MPSVRHIAFQGVPTHHFGYVPPPLPDETVYSTLAAVCRLAPDPDLTRRLFGTERTAARVDWPVGLRTIARAMPPTVGASETILFRDHTIAPAYLPFLSEARRHELMRSMYEVRAGEPAKVAGAMTSLVRTPERTRICPACLEGDARRHHRAYIHRVHQLPGVVVCPDHPGVILRDTAATRRKTYSRKAYVDVDRTDILGRAAELLTERERIVCTDVGNVFRRLLDGEAPHQGPEHVRLALRAEIMSRGYVFAAGKVDLRAFQNEFVSWFTPTLSVALGLRRPADHDTASWLCRRLTRRTGSIHPLVAILLSLFLHVDLIELMKRDCPVLTAARARPPRPAGVSKTYARFEARGAALKGMWHRHDLSLADMARRLHVSGLTVRRWAMALALPFPRPGPKVILQPVDRPHRPDMRLQIKANRVAWDRLLKRGITGPSRNPESRGLYWWLARYDRVWLRRRMPKSRGTVTIDWADRDRSLSGNVESATADLLIRVPPVWASKTRLVHTLGRASWIHNSPMRLPKTMAQLDRFAESRSAFAERFLTWKEAIRA